METISCNINIVNNQYYKRITIFLAHKAAVLERNCEVLLILPNIINIRTVIVAETQSDPSCVTTDTSSTGFSFLPLPGCNNFSQPPCHGDHPVFL